jgi:hypothetical protein
MPLQGRGLELSKRPVNRRSFIGCSIGAGLAVRSIQGSLAATQVSDRAAWMRGKWGMMVHWLAPGAWPVFGHWIGDLNRGVNQFSLDRFLEQFVESGASWIIFTIGQNTTYYASPNNYFDTVVGPGHCSERDLVGELFARVKSLRRRSIAYLPGEIRAPVALHEGFSWNPDDQSNFELKYTRFIREYATRFGSNCDGWWIDGCYDWPAFPLRQRHWGLWSDALRSGNPDAALAFNDGSFTQSLFDPLTEEQDYIAGECNRLRDGKIVLGAADSASLYLPTSQNIGSPPRQFHLLTPIDCGGSWTHPHEGEFLPPFYSDKELFPVVEKCLQVNGAVTLNVGISQEGFMSRQTIDQLRRMTQ